MLMISTQMGAHILHKNWIFMPNPPSDSSPAHRFSTSRRSMLGIGLNCISVRKSLNFDTRASKFKIFDALANGEVETSLVGGGILEKELEFSPTFSDYLKAMELVRADRKLTSRSDADDNEANLKKSEKELVGLKKKESEKKYYKGRDVELKDLKGRKRDRSVERSGGGLVGSKNKESQMKFSKWRDKESKNLMKDARHDDAVERSGRRWGLVEGILEKRIVRRSYDWSQDGSDYRGSGSNLKDEKNYSSYGRLNDARRNVDKRKFERKEAGPLENDSDGQKGREKNAGEVRKAGEFGISNGREDGMRYSSYGRFKDAEMVANDSSSGRQRFSYDCNLHKKQVEKNNTRAQDITNSIGREMAYCDLDSGMGDDKSVPDRRSSYKRHNVRKSEDLFPTKSAFMKGKVCGTNTGRKNINSEIHMHIWKDEKQSHKIAGEMSGDVDDIDLEDRAAFKTFEVFTDVRNRPRVLRMEMEERIQQLAKRLNATDVNMPEWQFSKMIHSARIKFTDHSILRVVQILGELGNWKRVLQVVEWLQSHERFKSYKSRYIYTTVLDVLGKAKRPIEALNVFHAMRQELSSYPDLAAYHCTAVTLGQAGLMKELFDVIDFMRETPKKKFKLGPLQKWDPRVEPDLIVYNAVLNACVQQKQWEGAFWVLQQLKQQSIKPSSTTYGLIMEVMLACGKYNLVHEFFKKMERSSIPSALNYKVLVNTLWREGKINEAVLAVQDMERRGIVGTASLYYDLARCLCSAGRCQEALLQINKICKVAKKPLVVTYTGLIQACLDSGNIENGTYIFNQMHKFCSPNVVTYNIMLKSYIEYGMFEEAKALFERMLGCGSRINGKASLVQKVLPDKFTFNTMMEACALKKKWDDFGNIYQQMLHHGHHFDAKRHLHMIMDAFRAGKVDILEVTWEHLAHSSRAPPPPIIKERFCMKLEKNKYTAAISCINIHEEIEINAFSQHSWLNLLKNNADRFNMDTIVNLARELREHIARNVNSNPVCQNLLKACSKFISDSRTLDDFANDDQTQLYNVQVNS